MIEKKHIFDDPKNVKFVIRALFISCFVLFAMDLVIHRHTVHPWESFFGFYAIFGFVSCAVLILLSKVIGRVLKVKEEYYDR